MDITQISGEVDAWRVGNTEFKFVFGGGPGSTADRFRIQKNQTLIDLYVDLCKDFQGARIVEVGIAAGGSAALLALLTSPSKLVACDIEPDAPALTEFIARHDLADVVVPFFGVDQGDKARLRGIVDAELGDQPIDLVIDDASHVWDKTVATFEVLFPLVRPGGLYVIEDWPAQYLIAQEIAEAQADPTSQRYADAKARYDEAMRSGATPRPPLARLGVELLLIAALAPEVIPQVVVNEYWLAVTRGPAPLDPDHFLLAEQYTDHFGWFVEPPGGWWYRRMWGE